jgi:hypothetical protein
MAQRSGHWANLSPYTFLFLSLQEKIMEMIDMKKTCMLFILAIVLSVFYGIATDQPAQAEESSKTISGKVTSVALGVWTPFGKRRATLIVEDAKGKTHTVHVGHKTAYIPHRTPAAGDKVSIACIDNKGTWAGVTVRYK